MAIENNQIILSKVAKIALKIVIKLKLFPYKIAIRVCRVSSRGKPSKKLSK